MEILAKDEKPNIEIQGETFIEKLNKKKNEIMNTLNSIKKDDKNINLTDLKNNTITNGNNFTNNSKNKELIEKMKEKFLK